MSARDNHMVAIDPHRQIEYHDKSEFDRIAFAMRALRRLKPKGMTVAVYSAVSALRVRSGRDLGGGEGARWAIVGIPPHASREQIAFALVELAGATATPFAIQMVLADGGSTPEA
ncbi:MAG: hypothetical protein HUU21_15655 [Polyangiaceae bacterium]|nr:hypothetical protein [Polyangiaceae bacterium]